MFDVNFSYFSTNKQLSMSWPTGSRAHRASGRIKGRARGLSRGRQTLRVGRDGGGGGWLQGPGGPEVLGVSHAGSLGLGGQVWIYSRGGGARVLTMGLIPAGAWAGCVAVSELLGASPVDALIATCLRDVLRVPVCGRPWMSGPLRACPSRPLAQQARAACSGFPSATCHWLCTGAGSRQGAAVMPRDPHKGSTPGAQSPAV